MSFKKRQAMSVNVVLVGFVFILLIVGLVVAVNGAYQSYIWGLNFDRHIGSNFELADQASSACGKAKYFDAFVNDLQREGLTQGQTTIINTTPLTELSNNYNTTLTLQSRLHDLCATDSKSTQYQLGMQQVTLQEFCWFPIDVFKAGYYLQHGVWGRAVLPTTQANRCVTTSHT